MGKGPLAETWSYKSIASLQARHFSICNMSTQQRVFVLCFCAVLLSLARADYQCSVAGYFADPNDCHGFYRCNADLTYTKGSCTSYGHFDPVDTCVWGGCNNPTTPSPGYKCASSGYFPDPEDCHAYYSCDKKLVGSHFTCTTYGYFNTTTRNCELGPCPTVAPPVTTPTTTTTTKKTTTPYVFVCPAPGHFADPRDCRRYYVCDSNLVATRGICMGGGGHWEQSQGGCVSGKC